MSKVKFNRSIRKVTEFPATTRSESAQLKRVLLAINARSAKTPHSAFEAKKVCEAFLAQFETVAEPVVQKHTKTSLSKLKAAEVDVIADEFGVTKEGNKEETIALILQAQTRS